MSLQKHTVQIAAISLALAGVFVHLGGAGVPAYAYAEGEPDIVAVIFSSRSFPSLSFSSVQISSVTFSSTGVSTVSFSSIAPPSTSFSSFSFSQEPQSSASISRFSASSVSFSFASTSFSFASISSDPISSSGIGGTFGGGTYGGVIGGSGLLGGGGVGTYSTGGSGGIGSAPRPSADPASNGTCSVSNPSRRACVPLVQPLGSSDRILVKPGAQSFIDYFNDAADLLITISVGFAVLWILIGSYFVMLSGSNGGMRGTGKSMITWALIGLIIVNFAGFFLRTLNSMFFT